MKKIDDEEQDKILIKEPYEYHNIITGIDRKNRIYKAGTGKYRSDIIIINNNIGAIFITKLSDEDTVVEEITHEKWKFFAASIYFNLEVHIEINFKHQGSQPKRTLTHSNTTQPQSTQKSPNLI